MIMSELADVCEKLDRSTDDIMNTLHQILVCQKELEDHMKNGYLMMSKARYNIGTTRISALQYKEDDLEEAITKVNITQRDQTSPMFSLCDGDEHSDSSSTVRQRRETRKSDTVQDLTDHVESVQLSDRTNSDQDDHKVKNLKQRDPLNWFGVLVPQVLRQSQSMFKRATDKCCDIANLKSQLLHQRQEHRELMAIKRQIMPPSTGETSEDTDDSVYSDSGAEST